MKDLSIVADWTTFADFDGFKKLYSHGPIVDCIVRKRRGVEVDALCWWVELVTSEGVFCKENMRRLCIPAFGSPARIAMHSLGKGCEGLPIRTRVVSWLPRDKWTHLGQPNCTHKGYCSMISPVIFETIAGYTAMCAYDVVRVESDKDSSTSRVYWQEGSVAETLEVVVYHPLQEVLDKLRLARLVEEDDDDSNSWDKPWMQ